MKRHRGVKQPVDGQAPRLKVDAEVSAKQEVGLARLDRNARHDPAAVRDTTPCGRTRCSVTIRPRCIERGTPSIVRTRSTSMSGSSGRRTRVG